MASEILPSNSYIKLKHFKDHLYESKILDEENNEPQYENGEMLRSLVLGNKNSMNDNQNNSVTTIFVPDKEEENIYENIGFVQNCLKTFQEDSKLPPVKHEEDGNIFRSSISMTIGNSHELRDSGSSSPDTLFLPEEMEDKSNDNSFKSSFAKSLLDSTRKSSSSPTSESSTPSSNCNITFKSLNNSNTGSPLNFKSKGMAAYKQRYEINFNFIFR